MYVKNVYFKMKRVVNPKTNKQTKKKAGCVQLIFLEVR